MIFYMDKAHSPKTESTKSKTMIVLRDARTPEEKMERRRTLQLIMRKLDDNMEFYTDIQLITRLHTAGWKCNRSTIYRDRKAIKRTNSWVQDLGESTYSDRQEQIDNLLKYTITEAKKQYEKEWTIKKAIRRTTPQGDTVSAETQTEIPGAKKMFLGLIQTGAELLMKHTNGENINRSAAILGAELDEAHKKIEELKSRLIKKGEKLEEDIPT